MPFPFNSFVVLARYFRPSYSHLPLLFFAMFCLATLQAFMLPPFVVGMRGHTVTMLRLLLYLSALEISIGVLFLCCIPSYWIRIAPPVTILWVYAWPLHAGLDIMAISPNYLWS